MAPWGALLLLLLLLLLLCVYVRVSVVYLLCARALLACSYRVGVCACIHDDSVPWADVVRVCASIVLWACLCVISLRRARFPGPRRRHRR